MIGPSGSGKTTALRAVAGFVRPAAGRVHIGGADVTDLPPYERGLAMVVQNYALFPHMRVADNVAFGLKARGAEKALVEERVNDALRVVGMQQYLRRYPRELSGGQQQRVAIARAGSATARAAARRALVGARRANSQVDGRRDLPPPRRTAGTDDSLCHPRPERGADALADRIAILKEEGDVPPSVEIVEAVVAH